MIKMSFRYCFEIFASKSQPFFKRNRQFTDAICTSTIVYCYLIEIMDLTWLTIVNMSRFLDYLFERDQINQDAQ